MITLRTTRNLNIPIPILGDVAGTAFFGHDNGSLEPVEVLVLRLESSITQADIRAIQKWRSSNQARRVVVCSTNSENATIFGPVEDRQPLNLSPKAAQRVLQQFLDDQSPINASRELISFYDSHGTTELGGVKNKGLFASHHIRENLPQRHDWTALTEEGQRLSTQRHRDLISGLGFTVASEDRNALLLNGGSSENRAVALLLEENENFDSPGGRFPRGPVSWGLAVAADHEIPWLIVLRRDQIRLHPGLEGVGVGQKGQAETYFELNLTQIDDKNLALLPLIFSAASLASDGDVQRILDDSSKYAASLGERLRERVYEHVVPTIAVEVAKQLHSQGMKLDVDGLNRAYSITLKILFRLLFQAYAEDRGLLPAGRNPDYDAHSLKTLATRDLNSTLDDFGKASTIWFDLQQVWDAIYDGNSSWQVPSYNGGLFGRDPIEHSEGASIHNLDLSDDVLGPALQALLVDMTEDGVRGPVDFRSLSVREFGTIYEGLLESSLSLAEVDLTVDASNAWVPAIPGDQVIAKAGSPYFHSASGERKATGSYFTPKFVVDHLVQRSIERPLDDHLSRIQALLRSGDSSSASREFFNFRVADLAMGSAHFLVAAVDKIEAKMRAFLVDPENSVPGVTDELLRLRAAATNALGNDELAIAEIEDASLLRRQIARRCVYGIDINLIAVELSRLALWIHTFVPGLPMSSLDHNLVCANSLTGIGSINEAISALIPNTRGSQTSFFDSNIADGLERAGALLVDVGNASEATKAEIAASATLARAARQESAQSKVIFDAAIAARMGVVDPRAFYTLEDLVQAGLSEEVQQIVNLLNPAHMPYLFPEVFMKSDPGFDALVGNPPWEKAQVEEHSWWGTRIPGLRGQAMNERKKTLAAFRASRPELEILYQNDIARTNSLRTALMKGPYPGLGKSNVDLYQAFAWRNWQLINSSGRIGLVLPRGAMSGTAMSQWRSEILTTGSFTSVTFATNARHWLFEQVHASYAVVFTVAEKLKSQNVRFSGPVRNFAELVSSDDRAVEVPVSEFSTWTQNFSFPTIQDSTALAIFRKLKTCTRLSDSTRTWSFSAVQGDLNGTTNKDLFSLGASSDPSRIPVYAGASFNLWDPDASEVYGNADEREVRTFVSNRLNNSRNNPKSAYFNNEHSYGHLPFDKARVAYRDITNATNTRTTITALLPPGVIATHRATFLVNKLGLERNDAFLLGVMSSIVFDWYVRRMVEMVLTFEIIRSSPVPYTQISSPLGERLIQIAANLAAKDERYAAWFSGVGCDPLSGQDAVDTDGLLAEMDALVALLFNLSKEEVQYIFENFHRGWKFETRLARTLTYFEEWSQI